MSKQVAYIFVHKVMVVQCKDRNCDQRIYQQSQPTHPDRRCDKTTSPDQSPPTRDQYWDKIDSSQETSPEPFKVREKERKRDIRR